MNVFLKPCSKFLSFDHIQKHETIIFRNIIISTNCLNNYKQKQYEAMENNAVQKKEFCLFRGVLVDITTQ